MMQANVLILSGNPDIERRRVSRLCTGFSENIFEGSKSIPNQKKYDLILVDSCLLVGCNKDIIDYLAQNQATKLAILAPEQDVQANRDIRKFFSLSSLPVERISICRYPVMSQTGYYPYALTGILNKMVSG
jgi:hypothetical protein